MLQNNGEAPGEKIALTIVYYKNCLYLFGYTWSEVINNTNDNSIYVYNLTENNWAIAEAKNAGISKRTYHYAVVYNDSMIILFGLLMGSISQRTDIWKFNFTTSEWSFLLNIYDFSDYGITGSGYVIKDSIYFLILLIKPKFTKQKKISLRRCYKWCAFCIWRNLWFWSIS